MSEQATSDILQLFIMFASSIFDSSVAGVIGSYLLIVFGAVTGAFWSLGREASKGGWSSLFYSYCVYSSIINFCFGAAHC